MKAMMMVIRMDNKNKARHKGGCHLSVRVSFIFVDARNAHFVRSQTANRAIHADETRQESLKTCVKCVFRRYVAGLEILQVCMG